MKKDMTKAKMAHTIMALVERVEADYMSFGHSDDEALRMALEDAMLTEKEYAAICGLIGEVK